MFHKLSRYYQKCKNHPLVKIVNKSFIYHLLKSFIIILLLTYLVFLVKPNQAFVYGDLQDIKPSDYEADRIVVNDIYPQDIYIYYEAKIIVDLNGLSINDQEYHKGDYLEIVLDYANAIIIFQGKIDHLELLKVKSEPSNEYILYSNDTRCYFIGEQSIRINFAKAYIKNNEKGSKESLDTNEQIVLKKTMNKEAINEYQAKANELLDENGEVLKEFETEYFNYMHIVEQYQMIEAYPVWIRSNDVLSNHLVYKSLSSSSLHSCSMIANGDVDVSFTPEPTSYTLKNQELKIASKQANMDLAYDVEQKRVVVSGYAKAATLSQMNLFPDFYNWYFSNIYMAPLTLVSTVFSAVSLMNKNKDKQDK